MGFGIANGMLLVMIMFFMFPGQAMGSTRRFNFEIKMRKVNRLCEEKNIVTVNGQFPGPQITVREGDRVIVTVINHAKYNVTIHWHGIRQVGSPWADGTAYVTQCPIQTGQKYVHDFSVSDHTGTLFWHAHITWLRVTLYGPIIILPKKGVPYPFPKPDREVPILLGEWWKSDTEEVLEKTLQTGGVPERSDAYTINGLPGISNCSNKDTYKLKVEPGKTYLLRLINAALNSDFFFKIADHTFTVVEADAIYVKQFETDVISISPGQTTNVLIKTKQNLPTTSFLMVAKPHPFGPSIEFNGNSTIGILEYSQPTKSRKLPLLEPNMPDYFDYELSQNYCSKVRSVDNQANVPKKMDRHFLFTVGLGLTECPKNQVCQGPGGMKAAGPINNVSFEHPEIALLQAHFFNKSKGIYTTDFPEFPPVYINDTNNPLGNAITTKGTRLVELEYNTSVQVVIQGTSTLHTPESHPFHLHGYDFYVVGRGNGNFDPVKDPQLFNLVDPAKRNTVNMPPAGWVAIRFVADNPGVWLMHCHLEIHSSWGMEMAWVVKDGEGQNQKLRPPPPDLPKC
ncbi:hypothetical protein Leryth_004228 [Lithospermum erythrorhizon]|nr:hypothetical protein Leryth_004228 [Lithospermum erythrorhizon]